MYNATVMKKFFSGKRLGLIILGSGLLAMLVAGCSPLSPESRAKVDPHLDFATVLANPEQYTDRFILAGGAIIALTDDDDGSLLELQRWEMSRYGVLLHLATDDEHILVHSPARLNKETFTVGRLVTLCGQVAGRQTLPGDQSGVTALRLELEEINLLDTPFRYGLHRNDDPSTYTRTPTYVPPKDVPGTTHPYDTTSYTYPYSPFTYRVR